MKNDSQRKSVSIVSASKKFNSESYFVETDNTNIWGIMLPIIYCGSEYDPLSWPVINSQELYSSIFLLNTAVGTLEN